MFWVNHVRRVSKVWLSFVLKLVFGRDEFCISDWLIWFWFHIPADWSSVFNRPSKRKLHIFSYSIKRHIYINMGGTFRGLLKFLFHFGMMDGCMDKWMNKKTVRWIDGSMSGGCKYWSMDLQMDGRMNSVTSKKLSLI